MDFDTEDEMEMTTSGPSQDWDEDILVTLDANPSDAGEEIYFSDSEEEFSSSWDSDIDSRESLGWDWNEHPQPSVLNSISDNLPVKLNSEWKVGPRYPQNQSNPRYQRIQGISPYP